MGGPDEAKGVWDVFSDALKSPVATLAAADLGLVVVIGFAFLADQNELALILSTALVFSLLVTLIAIVRARRLHGATITVKHYEPEFVKGSRKMQQDPGLGYRLEEHYNTELDPTISYIKTSVEPNGFSAWHRLRDSQNPIEARFYVLKGTALFEILDPISKKKYAYTLKRGDSLLVPDSFWRRFKNERTDSVLEMIVICIPRWHVNAFEYHVGETYELPP